MKKIKLYITELRAPFFTATIVSVILGGSIAYNVTGAVEIKLLFAALAWGVFLHGGANVANDYFDHMNGTDSANKEFVRPFSGGSRLIQNGLLTPKEVLAEFVILLSLAALMTIYLALVSGPFMLILGAVAVLSAIFYSAPPLFLAGKGIGEVIVGLNFGFLLCAGTYYVETKTLTLVPVLVSIPVSLLVAAILYMNEFPDYNADLSAEKFNLVVRLGRKNAVWGYILLLSASYMVILAGVLLKLMPVLSLSALLTIPLAVRAVNILSRHYDEPAKLKNACALTILTHLTAGILLIMSFLVHK